MTTDKAMVTDAMVRAAVNAVSDEIGWVEGLFGGKYDNAEEVMRDAIEAALSSLTLERGEAEPVAWHRTPRFVFHFSLGPDRPANATNNPDEWQPLYSTLSKRGEAEETPAPVQQVRGDEE